MSGATYANGNGIPAHLLEDAMASGEAFFPDDELVTIADQAGNPAQVRGADLSEALADGRHRIVPQQELTELEALQESESPLGVIRTAAQGIASGATFGASDKLLELAGADTGAMQLDREVNPLAFGGGQLAGAVAPLVMSGGAGAAAGAARLAPTAMVARGARAAGQVAESALAARGVPAWLARTGGLALEGASEGAIAGIGQAMSDSSLGGPELTAERLLAAAGSGALLGGVLGGGIGAGGAAVTAAREGAETLAKRAVVLQRAAAGDSAGAALTGQVRDTLSDGVLLGPVRAAVSSGAARATGAAADDIARGLGAGTEGARRRAQMLRGESMLPQVDAAASARLAPVRDAIESLPRPPRPQPVAVEAISASERRQMADMAAVASMADDDAALVLQARRQGVDATLRKAQVEPQRLSEALERTAARAEQAAEIAVTPERAETFRQAAATLRSTKADVAEIGEIRDSIAARQRIEAAESNSALGKIIRGRGALLGGLAGGPAAMAAGAAVDVALNPTRLIQHLDTLDRLAGRSAATGTRLEGAVRRIVSGAKTVIGGAGAVANAVAPRARAASRSAARVLTQSPEERTGTFERQRSAVAAYRRDPVAAAEAFQARAIGQRVATAAPTLATALLGQHQRAMQFLAARMPEAAGNVSLHGPRPPVRVARADQARFMRYAAAVEDPVGALEDIADGQASVEAVEVLREVYPMLYQDVRVAAMDAISSATEPIPYQRVLRLSLLLDIAGTPVLDPAFQQRYNDVREQAQATPPGGPPPQRQAPDLRHQYQTTSDRISTNV